jgi:hypothetical protein
MGLGYITGNSYRDNQLFQVDVGSIGEGDEASKYHTELEDSEQISLAGLVLLISREFFSSLVVSFYFPREGREEVLRHAIKPSPVTRGGDSSSTELGGVVEDDSVLEHSMELKDGKKSDATTTVRASTFVEVNEVPVTQVVGGKSQFHFAGRGDHSCTLICFRFLEIVLSTSVQMEAILPMMDETLEEGIIRHEEILSDDPVILDLVPNGELSPLEVDIAIRYPNLTAGEGIMCKITSNEKAFFQENLKLIKDRGFQGALITGRGYTYAIVLNSETQEILMFDSHGKEKKTPATIDKFASLEMLSASLAERYPYNQNNNDANSFLFLPVKVNPANSSI